MNGPSLSQFNVPINSIAILSGFITNKKSGKQPRWLKHVVKNHRNYAKKHGYDYVFRSDYSMPASSASSEDPFYVGCWSKPSFILDLLDSGYEYVFWIDADSIFTNFSVDLKDLIKMKKDFIFTGDRFDVCNSGHLFFKNTPFSKQFLTRWDESRFLKFSDIEKSKIEFWVTEDNYSFGDQTNLNALLNKNFLGVTDFIDAFNIINGYPGNKSRAHSNWQEIYNPADSKNIPNIERDLIRPEIRDCIGIVPQRRLNSYPNISAGRGRYHFRDPIVHFVSDTKQHLQKMSFFTGYLVRYGLYFSPMLWIYLIQWFRKVVRSNSQ